MELNPQVVMHPKDFPRHLYAKLKRMRREEEGLKKKIEKLRVQCFASETKVEEKHQAFLEESDDMQEMTIRVIEAKLALQSMYEDKRYLREDIGRIRRETFDVQNEIKMLTNELKEKRGLVLREQKNSDLLNHQVRGMGERIHTKQRELRQTEKKLVEDKHEAEREQIEIRNLDARYELMRATVQNVLLKPNPTGAANAAGTTAAAGRNAADVHHRRGAGAGGGEPEDYSRYYHRSVDATHGGSGSGGGAGVVWQEEPAVQPQVVVHDHNYAELQRRTQEFLRQEKEEVEGGETYYHPRPHEGLNDDDGPQHDGEEGEDDLPTPRDHPSPQAPLRIAPHPQPSSAVPPL